MSEDAASHAPADDEEISLLEVAEILAENSRLLVFVPLIVGVVALLLSFLITPIFTARTSFIPPQQQSGGLTAILSQLGGLAALAGGATGLKSPTDQFVSFLRSTTVADRLVDRFKFIERYELKYRNQARLRLASKTTIRAGKDGLIIIEVDDESPTVAANIANAYITELQTLLGSLALTESQHRRIFFEKQLQQTKVRLAAAQEELGAIGVSASAIRLSPEATIETVARLRAQVTFQEVKLAAMRGSFTETAPEIRMVQSELAALREQLKKSELSEPKGTPSDGYIEKYRDFKYQETLYEIFAKQFELAKVDEAREGAVIQVVDPALPPELKSRPRKALIAVLTTIATGFVLLLWVFLKRAIAKVAERPEDAARLASIRVGLTRLLPSKRGS